MLNIERWGLATVLALGLAACGGGGGGGGSSRVTGVFTTDNFAAVSTAVASSVMDSGSLGDAPEVIGAGPLSQAVSLARSTAQSLHRVGPQAVETREEACAGGGRLVVTVTYANASTLTPGDTVDVVADNCIPEVGDPVITGSFRLTVRSYSESSSRAAISLEMTFSDYGTVEQRVNGRADFSDELTMTSERIVVTFRGMAVSTPSETLTWDHRLSYLYTSSVNEVSVSGRATVDEETYALSQEQPYALDALLGHPVGGVMRITDANGARVDVTATTTRFTYTYYAAGATTPTAGPVDGPLYEDL